MKIVAQSLSDQVYALVKSEILKGNLKMGDRISEDNLAAEFGVSRTPIREALRRLSEYGLVNLSPRSHASITFISKEAADDIAELRVDLESFAIDHIKADLFDAGLDTICKHAANCLYSISIGERDKAFELDSLFHIAIVGTTGNEALIDTYNRLDAKIQLLRIEQDLPAKTLTTYLSQHNQLIQLLKDGDKAAAKTLVRDHIKHESLEV